MFTTGFRSKVLRSQAKFREICHQQKQWAFEILLETKFRSLSLKRIRESILPNSFLFLQYSIVSSLHLQTPARRKGRGLRIRGHCQTFIDRSCFILALNYRDKIGVITFVELGQEINSNLPLHHRYKHLFPWIQPQHFSHKPTLHPLCQTVMHAKTRYICDISIFYVSLTFCAMSRTQAF